MKIATLNNQELELLKQYRELPDNRKWLVNNSVCSLLDLVNKGIRPNRDQLRLAFSPFPEITQAVYVAMITGNEQRLYCE